MKDVINNIIRAAQFATRAHAGQIRQGTGIPYIAHPLRVASMIMTHPCATETMVVAALLHDVLEDTSVTPGDMTAAFGNSVTVLVEELTNQFTKATYPELNRKMRKTLEIERLEQVSREAKILKMLDRIDNLGEMSNLDPGFIRLYTEESQNLVEAIGDADISICQELLRSIRTAEKLALTFVIPEEKS